MEKNMRARNFWLVGTLATVCALSLPVSTLNIAWADSPDKPEAPAVVQPQTQAPRDLGQKNPDRPPVGQREQRRDPANPPEGGHRSHGAPNQRQAPRQQPMAPRIPGKQNPNRPSRDQRPAPAPEQRPNSSAPKSPSNAPRHPHGELNRRHINGQQPPAPRNSGQQGPKRVPMAQRPVTAPEQRQPLGQCSCCSAQRFTSAPRGPMNQRFTPIPRDSRTPWWWNTPQQDTHERRLAQNPRPQRFAPNERSNRQMTTPRALQPQNGSGQRTPWWNTRRPDSDHRMMVPYNSRPAPESAPEII